MAKSQHDKLSDLQLKFCHEYVKDLNATRAYQRAGYVAKTDNVAASSACELLRNPKIQAYLGEIAGLSEVKIIAEVLKIALFKITDIAKWDGSSYDIKPTDEWNAIAKGAVKNITFTRTATKDSVTTSIKVEVHDKLTAIEKLMKKYRLYPKDMPVLDAVNLLMIEGVATPEQADIIGRGIARIEEELKGNKNE